VIVSDSRVGDDSSGVTINEIVGIVIFTVKTDAVAEFIFAETSLFTRIGAFTTPIEQKHCWPSKLSII